MALRPEDTKRVEQLTQASAHLRTAGRNDLADTVDFVLTPEGASFVNRLRLQRLRQEGDAGKFGQNLAIAMPLVVREEIKANVAKLARETPGEKITVSTEAAKALEAFLAGEFVPDQPQRVARGAAEKVGNLNVRLDPDLRQRAENFGADHAVEFGWAPRASHIIARWLVRYFTAAGREQSRK